MVKFAAGVYAQAIGLPIEIVACSGVNDSLHQCITTGKLSMGTVTPSLANSMDIQVHYQDNFPCTLFIEAY